MNEHFIGFLHNKNVIMFITATIFMMGILSYFNNCEIIGASIITILALILLYKRIISYKYILLWIFIFYVGFFNPYLRIRATDDLYKFTQQDVTISGRITSIPNGNSREKVKFFFDADKINNATVSGRTLVTLTDSKGNYKNLNIGNRYEIKGKLRTPFKASNPSQFDYTKYLKNFNTYTVFYAQNEDCIKLDERLPIKWKFLQGLNNVRNRILETHSKYLQSPNIEILGGIVFGDDAIAPPEYIKDNFVHSGLLHILAASGMNVAFIYGFWFFILRRLKFPYKFTVISGMFVIILYTLMTGLGPSVIRAALMLLFILLGKLIDRDAHSVALLSLVATLMLIYNPSYINDVGFQLSFIVTFGLLTTANAVIGKFKNSKIPDWLIASILIPIIAQIWVAPIQMFYFNTFSTYSILANIATMPFLSVISFGGFISSILSICTPIANIVCCISDFVLKYFLDILVFISKIFSDLPFSLITTTHPSIFQIIIYYLIVLLLTYLIKIGKNRKALILLGILAIILTISTINIPSKHLEIITFDVQNADAFLIKTPQNKYFIIDTGKTGYKGSSTQAKLIILKYLKDRGIKNIEGLIVTHFDNDHSGGTVDILKDLKVKNTYLNSLEDKSNLAKAIYSELETNASNKILAQNNRTIYQENALTMKTYKANCQNDNENSIITLLTYKDFDMLFMGDAGIEAFTQIKKDIPHNIEVFKVGHHGAKNVINNEMLAHINPEISVISTGKNTFGHPRKGTIDTLRNTKIYRTDTNNSIKIISDGNKYEVQIFDNSKKHYQTNYTKNIQES